MAGVSNAQSPGNGGMADFHALEPGLYQVALPDDIKVVKSRAILREDDHFWVDRKWDPKSRIETITLRTNTDGLLVQAEALGVHVTTRIVELSQRYCRAEAVGYRLRSDGLLEVTRSAKEYDMLVELQKAALDKVVKRDQQGNQSVAPESTQALARISTEQGALALVQTLPPVVQAGILKARLEVQSHRLGLCETKAANRVIRYFVKKCGGVMKAPQGCKQIEVEFERAVLIKRLDPGQMAVVAASLYSPPPKTTVAEGEPEADEQDERESAEERVADEHVSGDERAEDESGVDDDDEAEQPDFSGHDTAEGPESRPNSPPARSQAPTQAPAPTASPTGTITPDGTVLCGDCQRELTPKELAFCQSERGRAVFGGANWCYSCQPKHKQQGGGV